jgi:ribosomal protein S18 acetylase RimI-like enzyme
MPSFQLRFEPLAGQDRSGFRSGEPALDTWFLRHAGQDLRRGFARTFLALDDQGIAGFYSLSMFTLELESIPPDLTRKLPKYGEVPAALIGRLARAERTRGLGIGSLLLADALTRVVAASRSVAAFAIVVDARNAPAAAFYRAHGFIPLHSRADRLFLPTETVVKALSPRP